MAGISVILRQLRTLMATQRAGGQTDAHLLEQFISQRDEMAFAALLERHGPMVLAVCRRILHDEHRAEDAFQATFLVLVRKAGSIRKQQSIASWLHGVALRLARKAKAEAAQAKRPDARNHTQSAVDVQAEASWNESQEILDDELQRLPENYRLPLVLCYFEGLTCDEAAAQLGWTANKLRGFLERGRNRLRCQLLRRGVTLSAAASTTLLADTILAATVPPLLTVATIHAAARFAAGTTLAACGISAPVAALTEGGLKMLAAKKTSAILALALFTAIVGSGVGIFAQRSEPVEAKQPNEPPALAVDQDGLKSVEAKKDRYGDPLPPGAIARLGTVRFRLPGSADALAFAPDGKTVAVTSRAGLFLFEADSGKRIKRLAYDAFTQAYGANKIAFSPDGKRLAAWMPTRKVTDLNQPKDAVRVWELASDQKPREYDVEPPIWLGWSAENEPLALCLEQGEVTLRELASGRARRFKCEDLLRPNSGDFVSCAPNGKALAVTDKKGTVHVLDTAKGAERCTISPIKDFYILGLLLSADGRILATSHYDRDRHNIHIWNAMTGKALRTVAADHVTAYAFSPDGKTFATAGSDGIRCCDVTTGREMSRCEGEGAHVTRIAFTGDGRTLATLGYDSCAFHVWDVATGKRKADLAGLTSGPYQSAFSPDGRRLLTGDHIWDLTTSEPNFSIRRGGGTTFSRDGQSIIGAGWDLWISDAATGERQHVIKVEDPDRPDTRLNSSVQLCADGTKLVAFSHYYQKGNAGPRYDETLLTGWDYATRKQLFQRRLPGLESWNSVSGDARLLAVASPGSRFSEPRIGTGQGPMRLEDLATGKQLLRFPSLDGQTWPVAFSPDGRLLASVNSNNKHHVAGDPFKTGRSLVLWEVATAAEVLSLPLGGSQSRFAISPNGRLLALAAPAQDIVVWNLAQGREVRRFKELEAEIISLEFAPDSRRLVSGLADSTLLIWDVADPAPPKAGKLTADGMAKAWDDLAGADAPRAFRSQGALVNDPDAALALFQKQLKPVRPADPRRLQKLIDDLESQQFPVRNSANKELEEIGGLAAGALRQALAKNSSLELRRRIETLLDKLDGIVTRPELLRAIRAVAVLETIASPEARKLLEAVAQGDLDARLSQEATGALKRLDQKSRPK